MKSFFAVALLSAVTLAAAQETSSPDADSDIVTVQATTDGISSCGSDWMAVNNVKTNNNAIERQGYNAAVDQFCAKARGQKVAKNKFLSMAARVWHNKGGNPATTGINGFVFFEIRNKKQDDGHVVDETACKTYLKALSATGSKCYGPDNKDTKGGTWQVGAEAISYHALPKQLPPTASAYAQTVLLDNEITELGSAGKGNTLTPFPTYAHADVTPIPCHSHNDYLRTRALFTALSAGCISIEADVWVQGDARTLTIAHDSNPGANGQKLTDLYLDPLKALIDEHGGVFPKNPSQPAFLLVDFKSSDAATTWVALRDNLAPLRNAGYLSHWDASTNSFQQRQLTIIASGNARKDISGAQPSPIPEAFFEVTNPGRAIFVDAVLDRDLANFNASNAFYASAKFNGKAPLDEATLKRMQDARAKGLVSRLWDTPGKEKWQGLVDQGVGRLDVDALEGLAGVDWHL